jgi:hypothetical protein
MNTIHVLKMGPRYYTALTGDRQSVYGFRNMESAKNCKKFLEQYRTMNGVFPRVDGGSVDYGSVRHEPGAPMIHVEPLEDVQNMCLVSGLGLLGIEKFDYMMRKQSMDVILRAGELGLEDDREVNPVRILKLLLEMDIPESS